MKKIILSIFVILLSACTSIDTTKVNKTGISLANRVFNDKGNLLEIVRKFSFLETTYMSNKDTEYSIHIYKNTRLEMFKPKNTENKKVIYFVHGGAFIVPLINLYRQMAEYMLEVDNSFDIVFVDYRELPNNFYPSGNIDTENGLEWLETKYDKIYMLGDSAGGNLVMSTLIKRKNEGKSLVNGVVLYSPFLDISYTVESRESNKNKDLLLGNPYKKNYDYPNLMKDNEYFKTIEDKKNPYVSPLFYDNFEDFPPTYIEVGDTEALYDDAVILHNKIKGSVLKVIPNLFHDFQINITMKLARDSIKNTYDFLNSID